MRPQGGNAKGDARALAWEVLQRVESGGYADAVLAAALATSELAPRDRALASRLVYGTLAWQGYLDHILAAFSKQAVDKLDAPIRCLLRLALLQICKLDRVPTFAAVDTAVNLSKRHRGGSASGFVNAVLRRAARQWAGVSLNADSQAAELALRWSHPEWLVRRWLAELGVEQTSGLLAANNEEAPTALRVNTLRATRQQVQDELLDAGIASEPCQYSPVGLRLLEATRVEDLPGFAAGRFSVQGEASQLVALLAAPQPGTRVLDACAAPGGKATHLGELMHDQGQVVALDVHRSGVAAIEANARRLGLSSIKAEIADAAAWQAVHAGFDTILVDAPCSGLGTLRQHPEIRWRRSPSDVTDLARRQAVILSHLVPLLRPGGALVYSTCTLMWAENEEQVATLLSAFADLHIDDPRPYLPQSAHVLFQPDGSVRMLPHQHGLDGFFAIRLQRHQPG